LAGAGDSRPLVSIITPSFNQGRFLGDCIASVASQSYRPIEHIVFDGGSTDETLEVLGSAPATVSWVSESDRGQSDAINKAFARSRGQIVGWLNSDDAYFSPDVVAAAVALFLREPAVKVAYGHAALVNEDGLVLQLLWAPRFSERLLPSVNFISQPTVFLRRNVVADLLVDESYEYSMDRELWLRLSGTHRFKRIDRIVAIDRHHPARKVYTPNTRRSLEDQSLDERYVRSSKIVNWCLRRAYGPFARLAGVRLLTKTRTTFACDLHVDGIARLGWRQFLVRRRKMELGTAASRTSGG
jgi:glycosyltransferase involved in cell wall biosynthesis